MIAEKQTRAANAEMRVFGPGVIGAAAGGLIGALLGGPVGLLAGILLGGAVGTSTSVLVGSGP